MSGTDEAVVTELTRHVREIAETTFRKMPLYRRVCVAAAEDTDVARRLLARPEQRRVNSTCIRWTSRTRSPSGG